MRLRNKRTGETGNLVLNINPNRESYCVLSTENGDTLCGNAVIGDYDTLAELAEEWEDYEEPKEYWFIGAGGEIQKTDRDPDDGYARQMIATGNYFETKEEAEKAVEKLKAWKRLKDKGVKFTGYGRYDIDGEKSPHISFSCPNFDDLFDDDEMVADLDLLFGGEE